MSAISPVIIIGMHRSGTSLITNILEKLGFFMGHAKDENQEAFYFLQLNEWLFHQTSATWYAPQTFDDLMAYENVARDVIEYLQFHIRTPHTIRFLGLMKYLRYRRLDRMTIPWGWKDPRNTFTLPIWQAVFPDLRVIHIYRNGVDVAQSLATRSLKNHQRSIKTLRRWRDWDGKVAYALLPIKPPFALHQTRLEQGFSLWETYIARADRHMAALSSKQGLSVCYEEFLQNSVVVCSEICDFLGLQVTQEHIRSSVQHIKDNRAYAYKNDDVLVSFYNTIKSSPYMKAKGY